MRMRKIVALALVLALVLTLCGCESSGAVKTEKSDKNGYKIAVVPKTISISWFQRMEQGVKEYNAEHGTDYFFGGPTDVADQVTYIEQLLAEDWDAICIVPHDVESIAPMLEKARKEGIVVITHEAETIDPKYFDYDLEPFVSTETGAHYGETIVNSCGGEGMYFQFVGSLNAVSHNVWCDAADEYIAAHSDMVKLGRYETQEDMAAAYNQTKELLQAHPEIVAIQGCCSTDLAGAAKAVEELGLQGKITITGNALPSVSKEHTLNGTIETFSMWDPGMAGKAMLALAEQVLSEKESFDPTCCTISVPGYEHMTVKNNVLYGQARCDVTKDNIDDYGF